MQNVKVGDQVRISSKRAAAELDLLIWSQGKVTWKADRSDTIEVDLGARRVMIRSSQVERVRCSKRSRAS